MDRGKDGSGLIHSCCPRLRVFPAENIFEKFYLRLQIFRAVLYLTQMNAALKKLELSEISQMISTSPGLFYKGGVKYVKNLQRIFDFLFFHVILEFLSRSKRISSIILWFARDIVRSRRTASPMVRYVLLLSGKI